MRVDDAEAHPAACLAANHVGAVALADACRSFAAAADCVTSPTYVPDLTRMTVDLVIDGETGLWHLANAGAVSWADFAVDLATALNLPAGRIEALAQAAMGWVAARPRHAPLGTECGMMMPTLTAAIAQFASVLKLPTRLTPAVPAMA
ncbi:sugar nucleotide-binding protein [Novosphingobium sp. SG720]|uniref:sugar nucleotide-binding protein n=1 Tax=Novosphingobium sp. SG720 TaxID=2586998 RepID=UPI001446B068